MSTSVPTAPSVPTHQHHPTTPATPTTPQQGQHGQHQQVPLRSLVRVEVLKMLSTRSGFWLLASVGLLSAVAVLAVMTFGTDEAITQGNFTTAVGAPIAIILPVLAVLAVTSEYSQRTTLTTYTLVARRGRVILAKALAVIGVGIVAIVGACLLGALGYVIGGAVRGVDLVWEMSALDFAHVVLGNVIGMLMGFTLGVLLRNSPAGVVAYLVYALVLPNLFGTLAYFREGFHDVWPWVDLYYNATNLFARTPDALEWAQLGVTAALWMGLPLLLGLRLVLRSEVK